MKKDDSKLHYNVSDVTKHKLKSLRSTQGLGKAQDGKAKNWQFQEQIKNQKKVAFISFEGDRMSDYKFSSILSCLGPIKKAYVCGKKLKKNRNFGFVTFRKKEDFEAACLKKSHTIQGVVFYIRKGTKGVIKHTNSKFSEIQKQNFAN